MTTNAGSESTTVATPAAATARKESARGGDDGDGDESTTVATPAAAAARKESARGGDYGGGDESARGESGGGDAADGARLGVAVAAGAVGAAGVYALLRIGQAVLVRDADPALVIYSEHAGYFWRAWTAGYAGGAIAFVAWLCARRDPRALARGLAVAVPVAAVLAAAQGLLVP
ncbi:MAG: hypothetical protein KF837_12565 [Labilithrix sp.]|nr:hypothetical protein [Labilithrix sp.]